MTIMFQGPRTPCTPTFANEKVLQNNCEDQKKYWYPNIDEINCYDLHDDDDIMMQIIYIVMAIIFTTV